MNAERCLELLGGIRSLSIATVDAQGGAQVRIIDTLCHDGRLYFVTARGKAFYREIQENETIGIVGMTKDWKMVRLIGSVKAVGREYVDLIFEKFRGINDVYPGDKRKILDAFCVESGQGELFDLGGSPVRREGFAFGGAAIQPKGFVIADECIACGICAEECPQACIDAGAPYVIRQMNCLHCGLCVEVCPAGAVLPRH